MKKLFKRILLVLLFTIIVGLFLVLVASCSVKIKKYRYLTYENEWGISSKCYVNENQHGICFEGNELVQVRQFYEQ